MTEPLSDDEDLLFNFGAGDRQEKFDQAILRNQTGMRLVDFLVELEESHHFIEVKDGENPHAENPDEIRKKLKNGELIHVLASKYRESRFFFSFQVRSQKRIRYIVLLWLDEIDNAMRSRLTDQLKSKIPCEHRSFSQPSVDECIILDVHQFKKRFGESCVWRKSDFED